MSAPTAPTAYDLAAVPRSLRERAQWVLWRFEERDGKKTKVPYQATHPKARAESTNRETWATFEEAQKAFKAGYGDGVGFVFSADDPYFGVDIDGCIDTETGEISEQAAEIVRRLHSYTELSPSGTGLHIIGKGSLEGLNGRRKGNVEMYDRGRYFTVTGQRYGALRGCDYRQNELDVVHELFVAREHPKAPERPQAVPTAVGIDDTALLEKMFASKHGVAIRALWDGDTSAHAADDNDGASEADLALVSHLSWWCDYDPARVDKLFRQSGLMRDKWDEHRGEQTYGQITLDRAHEGKGPGDGYSPEAGRITTGKGDGISPRPEIVANGRWLRDISDDAKAALLAANDPETRFMRGSILARVNGEKIEPLTNTTLKSDLDRIADFVKESWKQGEDGKPERIVTPTRPPADLAPDLLGRLDLELPELDEVVNAPVFLPDGSLLAQDGYDREHKILLKLRGLSGLRSDLPVADALRLLDTVYADFPFTDTAGRAHTLALTLERFVRPLIQGATPMYLIDAPARGTGKGLLAEVSNLIPLGYFAPTMSQPRDSDEAEKRITSVLLEARPVVFWDNVTRLGSDPLHAVLTSQIWQGRILGKSETVTVPNRAVWLASGNNVELSDEMTRRIIPIRLDAGVERPEERTGFTIEDLPGYVRGHRSELVSACLSLIQAWVTEGMPRGKTTLGRYESWAGVLGGILAFTGVEGFLGGRERLHSEADKETTEWASFCEAWWSTFGERAVTASELFEIVKERKLLLDLWAGRSGLAAAQRFGRALTSRRDRVFGGFKLMNAGKDAVTNSNAYRLERVATQTTETRQNSSHPAETASGAQDSVTGFVPGSDAKPGETRQEPGDNPETRNDVQNDVSRPSTPSYRVSGVSNRPPTRDTPPEVRELYRRFKAGGLKGVAQPIPGGTIPDLEQGLRHYFSKKRLTDTERHDLLKIARAVVGECETVVLG